VVLQSTAVHPRCAERVHATLLASGQLQDNLVDGSGQLGAHSDIYPHRRRDTRAARSSRSIPVHLSTLPHPVRHSVRSREPWSRRRCFLGNLFLG